MPEREEKGIAHQTAHRRTQQNLKFTLPFHRATTHGAAHNRFSQGMTQEIISAPCARSQCAWILQRHRVASKHHDKPRALQANAVTSWAPAPQSFIRFFAPLIKRPKALSFFRLSRYDISWYSDSFLSLI